MKTAQIILSPALFMAALVLSAPVGKPTGSESHNESVQSQDGNNDRFNLGSLMSYIGSFRKNGNGGGAKSWPVEDEYSALGSLDVSEYSEWFQKFKGEHSRGNGHRGGRGHGHGHGHNHGHSHDHSYEGSHSWTHHSDSPSDAASSTEAVDEYSTTSALVDPSSITPTDASSTASPVPTASETGASDSEALTFKGYTTYDASELLTMVFE
ncbi:hypothetical protein GGI15_002642 [Coemansia interrupta]|uniref:Uncharacterized protein n=1 Tax=Coemansia interrupta TaxID=1126814 RepID=A0A9W8HKC7_9FUNG|nr:hypothetical protein GGI15_002642 [Coemansia interrupta]